MTSQAQTYLNDATKIDWSEWKKQRAHFYASIAQSNLDILAAIETQNRLLESLTSLLLDKEEREWRESNSSPQMAE